MRPHQTPPCSALLSLSFAPGKRGSLARLGRDLGPGSPCVYMCVPGLSNRLRFIAVSKGGKAKNRFQGVLRAQTHLQIIANAKIIEGNTKGVKYCLEK